jgi:hypothetical protein
MRVCTCITKRKSREFGILIQFEMVFADSRFEHEEKTSVSGRIGTMIARYRQEVFNVVLAQLLQERGIVSAPENILQAGQQRERRMPDIIVNFSGLRTAIEGEVDDNPNAKEDAANSAQQRVEEGIAHIGIAVVYPSDLRKVEWSKLKKTLAKSALQISIITESGKAQYVIGGVPYLENALRRTFDQLVKEDVVATAVAAIEAGIKDFSQVILRQKGAIGRIAESLEIHAAPSQQMSENDDENDG